VPGVLHTVFEASEKTILEEIIMKSCPRCRQKLSPELGKYLEAKQRLVSLENRLVRAEDEGFARAYDIDCIVTRILSTEKRVKKLKKTLKGA
jgi:hypothetical protein